jgi:hypothetical protein
MGKACFEIWFCVPGDTIGAAQADCFSINHLFSFADSN